MTRSELINKFRFITKYPDLFAAAVETMVDEDDMAENVKHDHCSVTCPDCGDLVNSGCEIASERLLEILNTGIHWGVFGGKKLEEVAQGILKLQAMPKPDEQDWLSARRTREIINTWPIKTVVIDGVEYIPKDTIMPPEVRDALRALDSLIWAEGYYDSSNAATEKFAVSLYPHIKLLNQILQFKK